MVFPGELPVPSSGLKKRIGCSFPGMKLQWATLNGEFDYLDGGRGPLAPKQAIGITVAVQRSEDVE